MGFAMSTAMFRYSLAQSYLKKGFQSITQQDLCYYKNTPLRIIIPRASIIQTLKNPFSYDLIEGKAVLIGQGSRRGVEVQCFIASGNWAQLGRQVDDQVDIIGNLPLLLPKMGKSIGLFTCQNGIQNDLEDFKVMCESVTSQLTSEKPLFIGLYNPTAGKGIPIVKDLYRLTDHWNLHTASILLTRQLFFTFASLLPKINPQLLWSHIAHSEGGLLAHRCLINSIQELPFHLRESIKRILITLVFGGVASIPDKSVYQAFNTYSNQDIALHLISDHLDQFPRGKNFEERVEKNYREFREAGRANGFDQEFIQNLEAQLKKGVEMSYIKEYPHFSKKNGYTIKVVESLVKNPPMVEGDHGFAGDTYQYHLKQIIEILRKTTKIYDAKSGI